MRVSPSEYLALDLEAHARLRSVPLHDVSAVDLPHGGSGRTVADARRLLLAGLSRPGAASRFLFALRRALGRVFGWDGPRPDTREGPFQLVYELPNESVSEVRNATVHAFVCMALVPRAGGYRFYFAVYVEAVSRFTPVYMAAIEPFRRFIVYPAMLSQLRGAWEAAYP